jgi:RimJ/RimL family protein N-acetyltransferase
MNDDVRLRAVVEADLDVFFEHEHDAEAAARVRWTPRDRERFMTHWHTRILGDASVLVRAVTVDGALAGNVVSWWDEDGRRFLGYWFGREYWGRGIGTRALALFLDEERARPLHADPFAGNTASVRLLRRLGFEHRDTIRDGDEEQLLLILPAADA